jgi:hypothetical protein
MSGELPAAGNRSDNVRWANDYNTGSVLVHARDGRVDHLHGRIMSGGK